MIQAAWKILHHWAGKKWIYKNTRGTITKKTVTQRNVTCGQMLIFERFLYNIEIEICGSQHRTFYGEWCRIEQPDAIFKNKNKSTMNVHRLHLLWNEVVIWSDQQRCHSVVSPSPCRDELSPTADADSGTMVAMAAAAVSRRRRGSYIVIGCLEPMLLYSVLYIWGAEYVARVPGAGSTNGVSTVQKTSCVLLTSDGGL